MCACTHTRTPFAPGFADLTLHLPFGAFEYLIQVATTDIVEKPQTIQAPSEMWS